MEVCVYRSRVQIEEALQRVVYEITTQIPKQRLVLMGVLNGGLFTLTDLAKQFAYNNVYDIVIDTVGCSSYEGEQKSAEFKYTKQPSIDLKDRVVILVDDIVDTGETMLRLKADLMKQGAIVYVMSLITRVHTTKLVPDFTCFTTKQDHWFIGYGMDTAEGTHRNMPEVFVKVPETKTL